MYYTCRETQPSFCAKDSERPVNWNLSYLTERYLSDKKTFSAFVDHYILFEKFDYEINHGSQNVFRVLTWIGGY